MQKLNVTITFYDRKQPEGIFIMDRFTSPAVFLYTPRALTKEATTLTTLKILQNKEFGIYLLYGDGSAYVGQTQRGVNRLLEHYRKKNFWEHAFMMLFPNEKFNLDKISCLESNAIKYFQSQNKYLMQNTCNPNPPISCDFTQTEIDEFLEQFLFFIRFKTLLPLYGSSSETKDSAQTQSHIQDLDGIKQPQVQLKQKLAKRQKFKLITEETTNDTTKLDTVSATPQTIQPDTSSILIAPDTERTFFCHRNKNNIRASLVMRDGKYVLLKGSYINFNTHVNYGNENYIKTSRKLNDLRQKLFDTGKIISTVDGSFILIEDCTFNNPNAAGMFVMSTGFNGRSDWKTATGEEIRNFMPKQKAKGYSAK